MRFCPKHRLASIDLAVNKHFWPSPQQKEEKHQKFAWEIIPRICTYLYPAMSAPWRKLPGKWSLAVEGADRILSWHPYTHTHIHPQVICISQALTFPHRIAWEIVLTLVVPALLSSAQLSSFGFLSLLSAALFADATNWQAKWNGLAGEFVNNLAFLTCCTSKRVSVGVTGMSDECN